MVPLGWPRVLTRPFVFRTSRFRTQPPSADGRSRFSPSKLGEPPNCAEKACSALFSILFLALKNHVLYSHFVHRSLKSSFPLKTGCSRFIFSWCFIPLSTLKSEPSPFARIVALTSLKSCAGQARVSHFTHTKIRCLDSRVLLTLESDMELCLQTLCVSQVYITFIAGQYVVCLVTFRGTNGFLSANLIARLFSSGKPI